VFWLNGSRIISTNRRVYADKQRVSIEGHGNTYNLLVRNVQQWDDGEYSCQVPGPHTIVQTSRVIISSEFELCSKLPDCETAWGCACHGASQCTVPLRQTDWHYRLKLATTDEVPYPHP